MKIRLYTPLDLDGCLSVFASNLAPYVSAQEMTEFWRFLRDQANVDCPYVVAEDAGQVRACGGLYVDRESGVATLCWGLVHRDHHKKKLGTIMLVERLAWAAADPAVRKVEMNTSQHTVAFFQRFGFVPLRRIADGYGYGLDRIDMELALRPEVRRLFNKPTFDGVLPPRDPSALRLAPITLADGEDFVRMCAALSREDPSGEVLTMDRARQQLPELLGQGGLISGHYLEQGRQRLGYVLLATFFSNELGGRVLYLDELYVDISHRRSGVGAQAVELVGRWAQDRGYTCLSLEVAPDNLAALALYRRAGFSRVTREVHVRPLGGPRSR